LQDFLKFIALAGPTNDDQPTFVWSTSPFAKIAHLGQVDRWDFPIITVDLQYQN
jgi:hypothetical protein